MFLRSATTVLIALLLFPAFLMAAPSSKEVVFSLKGGTTVTFSHGVHLEKSNNCRLCHSAIFDLSKHRNYTMADMEKGKSCGACHNGAKAFSVAKEKDCTRCHKSSPGAISYNIKGADAFFSHDSHAARSGGKCNECHNGRIVSGKRGVSMARMEKGASCGACHNGKKAFTVAANCGNCHKGLNPREVTFKIKSGITDAQFSHKFHTRAYGCNDCHTKLFPHKAGAVHFTMADMEKGKSCGACHNGKSAFASTGDCAKCHKGFKPAKITFKSKSGTINGYFSHQFHLDIYKCQDCHTKIFPYGRGKAATMADMQKNASCGSCHNGKDAFNVTGNCAKCHHK